MKSGVLLIVANKLPKLRSSQRVFHLLKPQTGQLFWQLFPTQGHTSVLMLSRVDDCPEAVQGPGPLGRVESGCWWLCLVMPGYAWLCLVSCHKFLLG